MCGSLRWTRLPDPGEHSMASDWRVVREPLGKYACEVCGLGIRPAMPAGNSYASGYALYAHAPGNVFESARQSQYARWIAEQLSSSPRRVLDVGCGNGSLLMALARLWPDAQLLGCDPSAESVTHRSAHGLRLWQGTAQNLPSDLDADLIVSVNVVEHTDDPEGFIAAIRGAATHDTTLIVICPDGGRPGVELLFADHLWSLTAEHLASVFTRSGFRPVGTATAPASLGVFQMMIGRRDQTTVFDAPRVDPRDVNRGRASYLDRWRALDDRLSERLPENVVCFGIGEAAGLLRSYAPRSWSRVRACTADAPAAARFDDLEVVALESVAPETALLVGVRSRDQEAVAARLRARFPRVTTWYDLVGEEW